MTYNRVRVMGAVTIANPGGGDGSGLTDTQLRATPVPVSGSFYQVTQPVSGTFWQATQPVSGTFWQATQPVSGTFFQATQPVSAADGAQVTLGAKADAKSTATDGTAVTIMQVLKEISAMAQAPASTPVTGTFWQATQPVSSTQLPAALDGSGFLKTHEQGTATVSGTVTANAGTNLNTSALALDSTVA